MYVFKLVLTYIYIYLSNKSQRTSKRGKNISDTLGCALCATFLLPYFDANEPRHV